MAPNTLFPQLDIKMAKKLYFPYFQGDLMLGFVVVGKDLFPVLYLKVKLGFACDTKETVTQFDLWQVVVIAYLSLLASVWKYFYYAKLMFLVFSVSFWFYCHRACLMDEPASAFIPLTISPRACLFDLICFDFLRGATVVLHLISGASWLTRFT